METAKQKLRKQIIELLDHLMECEPVEHEWRELVGFGKPTRICEVCHRMEIDYKKEEEA